MGHLLMCHLSPGYRGVRVEDDSQGFRKRSEKGMSDLISSVPVGGLASAECAGQCGHHVREMPGDRCLGMSFGGPT